MEYLVLLLALPAWALCIIAGAVLILLAFLTKDLESDFANICWLLGLGSAGFGLLVAVVKLFIWMVME